jgi:hypothetical protein
MAYPGKKINVMRETEIWVSTTIKQNNVYYGKKSITTG